MPLSGGHLRRSAARHDADIGLPADHKDPRDIRHDRQQTSVILQKHDALLGRPPGDRRMSPVVYGRVRRQAPVEQTRREH